MVPLTLEDPKSAARRMRALVQPFTAPYWYDAPERQPDLADLERAANMLDVFIDALDESLPGIYREMVPADEDIDWASPRGILPEGMGRCSGCRCCRAAATGWLPNMAISISPTTT